MGTRQKNVKSLFKSKHGGEEEKGRHLSFNTGLLFFLSEEELLIKENKKVPCLLASVVRNLTS